MLLTHDMYRWGKIYETKKNSEKFAISKDEETDFSCERMEEMFDKRQFDGRKHSDCESLKALADLLIVTDRVKTIKRGGGEQRRESTG